MDTISIVATSVGLVQTLKTVYAKTSQFSKDYRDAESDINAVTDDLVSLGRILTSLKQHEEQYGDGFIPDYDLRCAVKRSILACFNVVREIGYFLDGYLGGSWGRKASWAAFGRGELKGLHEKVASHKGTLQFALSQVLCTQTAFIASDTRAIKGDTTGIKFMMGEILSVLREKRPLSRQGSIRTQDVPEVCDQIRRTTSEVKAEYLKYADRRDTGLATTMEELDCLRDTAVRSLQSSATRSTHKTWQRGFGSSSDDEPIEVPEELTRFVNGIARISSTRPRDLRPYFYSNIAKGYENIVNNNGPIPESPFSELPSNEPRAPPSASSYGLDTQNYQDVQEQRNRFYPQTWAQDVPPPPPTVPNNEWDTQKMFPGPPDPSHCSPFLWRPETESEPSMNAMGESGLPLNQPPPSHPGSRPFLATEIRSFREPHFVQRRFNNPHKFIRSTERSFLLQKAYKATRAICTVEELNTALSLTKSNDNSPPPRALLVVRGEYDQDRVELKYRDRGIGKYDLAYAFLKCLHQSFGSGYPQQDIHTIIDLSLYPWTSFESRGMYGESIFNHLWDRRDNPNVYRFLAFEEMDNALGEFRSPQRIRIVNCHVWVRRSTPDHFRIFRLIERIVDSWQPTLNVCLPSGYEACIVDPAQAAQLQLSGFGSRLRSSSKPPQSFRVEEEGTGEVSHEDLESKVSAAQDYISRQGGGSGSGASDSLPIASETNMTVLEQYLYSRGGRGKSNVNWGQVKPESKEITLFGRWSFTWN